MKHAHQAAGEPRGNHMHTSLNVSTCTRAHPQTPTHRRTPCGTHAPLRAASLEATLQGAAEKATLTQQQLDATSLELSALQKRATEQGATLDKLHK